MQVERVFGYAPVGIKKQSCGHLLSDFPTIHNDSRLCVCVYVFMFQQGPSETGQLPHHTSGSAAASCFLRPLPILSAEHLAERGVELAFLCGTKMVLHVNSATLANSFCKIAHVVLVKIY